MLVSMTGYGQAFFENDQYRINVEMKSVNHRFSEVTVRLPRQFLFLEDKLKKEVSQAVRRGKVDVFLTVEGEKLVYRTLQVDWSLLQEFFNIHKEAEQKLQLNQPFALHHLLQNPDVVAILEKENYSESLANDIIMTTNRAAKELVRMRQNEGASLATDFFERLITMKDYTNKIAANAPLVAQFYHTRLVKRVADFTEGKIEIDENRILTEVALFAEKANIDEEITRLNSHIVQFESIIVNANHLPVGRKLDFLVQEMNREVNTIGSKSNDINISKYVVELKAELEKIKEQVQNIE